MTKKLINKEVGRLYVDWESLTSIQANLCKFIGEFGDGEVRIEDDLGSMVCNVYAKVLETDSEYTSRIAGERQRANHQRDRELKEYERLRAKFGEMK